LPVVRYVRKVKPAGTLVSRKPTIAPSLKGVPVMDEGYRSDTLKIEGLNMKHLLLVVLLVFAGESFALPDCPPDVFHNCFGTQTYTNGDKYVGEFQHNKRHGQGTATTAKGDKYVGEYKDGLPHGQGTSTWVTQWEGGGEKYVGDWKNGKMHGHGIYTSIGVGKYVGEWKDSFQYGHGIYTFFDQGIGWRKKGDIFVGEFLGNFRHGQGIYIHANGKETVGEWKHSDPWNTVGYDLFGRFRINYKDGVPYLP